MIAKISSGKAKGKLAAPPSKSMAHRLLLAAAMTEKSRVDKIDFSEDILATLDCLSALGTSVEIDGNSVTLGGFGKGEIKDTLFCRESGSTLRFFIPLCLTFSKEFTLFGSERLISRPQDVYEKICSENGFLFENKKNSIMLCGHLKPSEYTVSANQSSQFITGLMFALATLDGDSVINIVGQTESKTYICLTVKALADFGVNIERQDNKYLIKGGQKFCSREISVEGDYSNAAFFDALNLLGGEVEVSGLCPDSLQGDRVYKDLFRKIGEEEEIDLAECIDLAPLAFALSAYKGCQKFTGTRRLKIKESDRAAVMKTELKKFGIEVEIGENEVTVYGGKLTKPTETLFGHGDHRIVMALSVLLTITGGSIDGAEAVSKSLPDFFSCLQKLALDIEVL